MGKGVGVLDILTFLHNRSKDSDLIELILVLVDAVHKFGPRVNCITCRRGWKTEEEER